MMPPRLTLRSLVTRRLLARALTCVMIIAACAFASLPSPAATSGTAVGASVPSATNLDIAGCTGTDLQLGAFTVGTTAITPTTCDVIFGSSNDTSRLRIYQSDGKGSALGGFNQTGSTLRAAPLMVGAASASTSVGWEIGYTYGPPFTMIVQKTTDGGATWSSQTACGVDTLIYDVDAVSTTAAVLVGAVNRICYTTNGGTTWQAPTTSPTGVDWWTDVEMLASGEGWAVGTNGRIAHTVDGGVNWTNWASLPGPNNDMIFTSIASWSTTRLYAAGYRSGGGVHQAYGLTSGDGGLTWTVVSTGPASVTSNTIDVAALSATSAAFASANAVYYTTDTGASYTQMGTGSFGAFVAYSPTTWEAFGYGNAARTTNAGSSWNNVTLPNQNGIYTATASSTTQGLVGGTNDTKGYTANAGATFTYAASSWVDLWGVSAWTADNFVAVGTNGVVRRTTNGSTFTTSASGTPNWLVDVDTGLNGVGVAVGELGTIIRTTDFGATWTPVSSGTTEFLVGVERADDGTWFAVGGNGTVLRSRDEGATWTARTSTGVATLRDLAVVNGSVLWVAGDGGLVAKSTDGGATWATQTSGATGTIYGITAQDANTATFVQSLNASNYPDIRRTTNGGTTWTLMYTPPMIYTTMMDIRYTGPNTLLAGGINGALVRSTDNGATWTILNTGLTVSVFTIEPLDSNGILVAGAGEGIGRFAQTVEFSDYANGSIDFSGSTAVFGACLQTQANTSATSWPVAGVGNCTAANLGNWRAVGVNRSAPTATLAQAASQQTNAQVALRFGAKASNAITPGEYSAGITFEVTAPDS